MVDIELKKRGVYLGKTGETGRYRVWLDVSAWVEEYEGGTGMLLYTGPKGTTAPMRTVTEFDGVKTKLYGYVTAEETKEAGTGVIEARWMSAGVVAKSDHFNAVVMESSYTGKDIGENTPDWVSELMTELNAADVLLKQAAQVADDVADISENIEEAETVALASARNAEAWAVGKRNGQDVEEGDPTYGNNAKKYAQDAGGSAETAQIYSRDAEAWANGTRAGSAVPSTDPTYQKNAKYYAEHAFSGTPEGYETLVEDVEEAKEEIDKFHNGRLLTGETKQALLDIFDHLVYTDTNAGDYIQALKTAWAMTPAPDAYLTAAFEPQGAIYDNTRLKVLRRYLTVKMWHVVDSADVSEDVIDYDLSGKLEAGKTCTITVRYASLTTTFTVAVSLPGDYQQVEWVGANGGSQCLRFATMKPSSQADLYKYEIEIDCQMTGWWEDAATNMFFSFSSNGGGWFGYSNAVGKLALGTTSGMYFDDNKTYDRHQYQFYYENNAAKMDREDGASVSRNVSWTSKGFTYLNLFGFDAGAQYRCHCKAYSFKVYYDGNLISSLVPCYRKADGEIGFYDVVRRMFCTNSGTDAFIKGSDV